MQLTLWTYEGPPHVGAMRIATAMKDVHYVLHAPQGDTYADLLFTMIERLPRRPPVTYTTFQARDLGGDTAELFKTAARDAYERFRPQAMLVGASCTAELIQDDPAGLAKALALPVPVIPLELPSYQKKENWGAAETFYQIVRTLTAPAPTERAPREPTRRPRCNILGPSALGFRHRDDLREIRGLLAQLGIDVHVVAPLGASPADIVRLAEADFNVVLYPEVAGVASQWLARNRGMPATKVVPIGVGATREFIAEVAALAGVDPAPALAATESRSTWYAHSVDSTYLQGKRVFVFGDATHAIAAARMATEELGFTVCGIGTYSREFARDVREAAKKYDVEALVTDDYLDVEARVEALQPDLVLGSQMERHIAKRLRVPCAVISGPVHVQDFPARHSPQMGFEGANVLFDTWVHPLMMGLEEHLIGMFRGDFEFHADAAPSHLGGASMVASATPSPQPSPASQERESAAPALSRWRERAGAKARSPWPRPTPSSSPPGPPTPSASCTRFRFSCAARRAATPSAMPASAACRPSPSRPCMTPKRISVVDARKASPAASAGAAAVPMRVVLVTMDSHLAGAAARANQTLGRLLPGTTLAVHAASDWSDDAAALERVRADIAAGDIVIATMLFMEDHFQPILPALRARRDRCDAMVCAMSAGEVMKLTRMGKFAMDSGSSGPMAFLKKLRGKPEATGDEPGARASAGAKQMRMLRRLPKILRFIPGTAQDVRAYFLTLQYWLAGSEQNVAQMVHFLVDRYADGPRRGLRGLSKTAEPVEYPEVGVYHPRLQDAHTKGRLAATLAALPTVATSGRRGTVGLLLMRSYLLAGNADHYDGVITAMEARGLRVVPAYATGLDARPAIDAFFFADGRPSIDALVSLTGFSLVGGPAYNDAKAAEEVLARLDVPYLAVTPVEFQTLDQWGASPRGLMPVESTMMVAIPELDGATGSMVFGGRGSSGRIACTGCAHACTFDHVEGSHDMHSCIERADMLAARVGKLVDLRRGERAERKVAAVIFNFPPNAGNTGTAAFLSVFESLYNTMAAMQREGYRVELPASVDELRERIIKGNAERYGASANVHARIAVDDHVRREKHLKEIEAQWGPAPGRQQSDGGSIFVLGERFGNVFVGIQPAFGYEGDPMRLLFERGFAPTHAFSAFYRWLREDFGADAALHFGTHGALEFMPGKQSGLSAGCWPDRLIGDLPNIYLYASNNPSEGTIAKRRAAATLVSYMTPPVAQAGVYKGLADLKALLDRYRGLDAASAHEAGELGLLIQAQAAGLDLAEMEPQWAEDAPARIARLNDAVLELEYTLIPCGLHVVGQAPSPDERIDLLLSLAEASHGRRPDRALVAALVAGRTPLQACAECGESDPALLPLLQSLADADRLMAEDHETPGLLRALDGRFIRPAPGGDLLRTPAILPTGRNLHGFDPFRIPSAYAVQDGARQADRLLARHMSDGHALPESIAIVLWGTDNLKSEGGPIAQALALMGARPRFDSYGRLAGAELMPLEQLGRPRIDVVITLSGIFRDLLPLQIKLLAEAAFLAAQADEPVEKNFIRKHALAFQAEHGGDLETAALRVFGNAEGAYGSNVGSLVDNSRWEDGDELAETYTRRKGFAYGRAGRPQQQAALLQSVLSGVQLAYQNLDSVELGVTTIDTYFDTLGGISRAIKRAKSVKEGPNAEVAPVYIGDQTADGAGGGTVRTLSEQVAIETRTRMLNPKWYEGMLKHGYEGVRQIEVHVTNTMGWSATTGQVQPWVYEQLSETFMLDPEMRERLATLNPTASAKVANRLLEASDRKYWKPDAKMLDALRRAGEELEDRLEGVYEGAPRMSRRAAPEANTEARSAKETP